MQIIVNLYWNTSEFYNNIIAMKPRKFFSNLIFIILITVITTAALIIIALKTNNWNWFARSGSIIVLAGGLLSTRKIVRLGFKALYEDVTVIDGGHLTPTPEEIEQNQQLKLDIIASQTGAGLLIAGTLVWGFGDLLGTLLK